MLAVRKNRGRVGGGFALRSNRRGVFDTHALRLPVAAPAKAWSPRSASMASAYSPVPLPSAPKTQASGLRHTRAPSNQGGGHSVPDDRPRTRPRTRPRKGVRNAEGEMHVAAVEGHVHRRAFPRLQRVYAVHHRLGTDHPPNPTRKTIFRVWKASTRVPDRLSASSLTPSLPALSGFAHRFALSQTRPLPPRLAEVPSFKFQAPRS